MTRTQHTHLHRLHSCTLACAVHCQRLKLTTVALSRYCKLPFFDSKGKSVQRAPYFKVQTPYIISQNACRSKASHCQRAALRPGPHHRSRSSRRFQCF